MHPQKEKMLRGLEEISQMQNKALREAFAVACAPDEYGWTDSLLTATVMVPLTGLGAFFNSVSILLTTYSADATWEKAFPTAPEE